MKRYHERPPLPGHGTMEDYSTPFFVVAGVLVWIVLVVVWAIFGLIGATLGAMAADRALPRRQGD